MARMTPPEDLGETFVAERVENVFGIVIGACVLALVFSPAAGGRLPKGPYS